MVTVAMGRLISANINGFLWTPVMGSLPTIVEEGWLCSENENLLQAADTCRPQKGGMKQWVVNVSKGNKENNFFAIAVHGGVKNIEII